MDSFTSYDICEHHQSDSNNNNSITQALHHLLENPSVKVMVMKK
ncbi:hypothetical protein BDL97_18G062900 [Sphagnum fallax]|nr:hypothetical protein BDL97_18G062900 [Sphagnum fallax]